MTTTRPIALALATALLGAVACQSPAGPSLADLEQARAQWASHHLTRYAYQYTSRGFFNTIEGQTMRLVVIDDTVRSARLVPSNDSVPVAPAALPTIDQLFAIAFTAQQGGRLTVAIFDPTFSFPAQLSIAGPPDASGTLTASNLELLP